MIKCIFKIVIYVTKEIGWGGRGKRERKEEEEEKTEEVDILTADS